jgi:preprotein translocase subunit SecD
MLLIICILFLGTHQNPSCEGPNSETIELWLAQLEPAAEMPQKCYGGTTLYLLEKIPICSHDISSVGITYGSVWNGATLKKYPVIALNLKSEAGKVFATVSKEHRGKLIAIICNGAVRAAPTILAPVTDGKMAIQVGPNEVEELLGAIQEWCNCKESNA